MINTATHLVDRVRQCTPHETPNTPGLVDDHSRRDKAHSHRASLKPMLPVELYLSIVRCVSNLDPASRRKTLLSLCLSTQALRDLAQPYLWKDPRDLDTVERQQRLRHAATVRPDLANAVRALYITWLPNGANSELIGNILTVCPNVEDLVLSRGVDVLDPVDDVISETDMTVLPLITGALGQLKSFCFSSLTCLETDNLDHQCCIAAPGRLESLTLKGMGADFLLEPCLRAISSRLVSLVLGQDVGLDGPDALESIGKSCPRLEYVHIGGHCCCADDVLRFSYWTPELRTLSLASLLTPEEAIEENWPSPRRAALWLADALPHWPRLENLSLFNVFTPIESLWALARKEAPSLRKLEIRWVEQGEGLDECVAACIRRQAPTLTSLELDCSECQVGYKIMQACALAYQLEVLSLSLDGEPAAREVDASLVDMLLDTCPKLGKIPPKLLRVSQKQDRWQERHRLLEEESDRVWELLDNGHWLGS